ncbi:hypothetical protein R3P38DRAFT_2866346 [Favolaschia claudopus]|uniref:MYND-type domain-containing protein n=1 Tax=Favolaschia claudopus TaxID=2862362 RepID=A0AAW0DJG6_9AGAR
MHQCLRVENILLLPQNLQQLALLALSGGNDDSPLRLTQDLGKVNPEIYIQCWVYCLPVWFAHLDPAGIPKGDNIMTVQVRNAILAISSLRLLDQNFADTGPDLWPRVWQWVHFIYTHRECFESPPPLDEDPSVELLHLISAFYHNLPTRQLISRTPGVRLVATSAWKALTGDIPGRMHRGYAYLGEFILRFMKANKPGNLEEIMEAAGSRYNLALMIAQFLKVAPYKAPTFDGVSHILVANYSGAQKFIAELLQSDGDRGKMAKCLVSGGVVPPLTSAMLDLSKAPDDYQGHKLGSILMGYFDVLEIIFKLPLAHKPVSQAVGTGVLYVIAASSVHFKNIPDITKTSVFRLIHSILPMATVYRTVVAQLETQTPSMDDIPDGLRNVLTQGLMNMSGLARERMTFMKKMASEKSLRACDNMDCAMIEEKSNFQRCSHCESAYYCSVSCQTQDWRQGGHRNTCHSLLISKLKDGDIGSCNRSYMRALLGSDSFLADIPENLHSRLTLMSHSLNAPVLAVFDYTNDDLAMPTRAKITSVEEFRASVRDFEPEADITWDEYISRAKRSRGRMDLHLMLVWDGHRTRRLMFPRRSNVPILHDGLARILDELESDSQYGDLMEKLQSLRGKAREDKEPVVSFHQ